jgi:hypothetical protein
VLLSCTKKTAGKFTGDIRFSRSLDQGQRFEPPYTVNNDGLLATHRFDSLAVSASGKVYLAWIDKRDKVAAAKNNEAYSGAAVYYAVSSDGGASFPDNHKVADSSCECCRIAIAPSGDDDVAILWRHIFPGSIRDHAAAILRPTGAASYGRATLDNWQINACPHHGPDMIQAGSAATNTSANTSAASTSTSTSTSTSASTSASTSTSTSTSTSATGANNTLGASMGENTSRYHIVWFSNGDDHKGIYYALSDLQTGSQSQLYRVDDNASASHPQLAQYGDRLYVAWKLFDGDKTHIRLITSADNGHSFVDKATGLSTDASSDHPLLIEGDKGVYLAWHTAQEGYRVKAL